MDFNSIKRYSYYDSYQRIKKIKLQTCLDGANLSCLPPTYENYLNKVNYLLACPDVDCSGAASSAANCNKCYGGIFGDTLALNGSVKIATLGTPADVVGFNSLEDSTGGLSWGTGGCLSPTITTEGYEVVTLSRDTATDTFHVRFATPVTDLSSNIDLSSCCVDNNTHIIFSRIELNKRSNNTTLRISDATVVSTNPYHFRWPSNKFTSVGDDFTSGRWCVKLYI